MVMEASAADRAAAFEAVRKTIEDAEDWIDLPDDEGGSGEKKPTQAAIIARLAMARCDAFFHDENREAYAIMHAPHDGGVHREVHRLKTKGFREWLLLVYFDSTNGVPNDNSIRSAIALLGRSPATEASGARRSFAGPHECPQARQVGHRRRAAPG